MLDSKKRLPRRSWSARGRQLLENLGCAAAPRFSGAGCGGASTRGAIATIDAGSCASPERGHRFACARRPAVISAAEHEHEHEHSG